MVVSAPARVQGTPWLRLLAGAQGGGVVDALIKDGSFNVRGVTRNADSAKAKALAARGVEVVQANQHDPDSVKDAVSGAYGVFLVTNFW